MLENRNNLLLPLTLFLVTVITRLPFTSKLLYHLDSVQFALALKHFDVTLHQPHPPGYFLYVMLGRLLNIFIPDANTVFVTISILFSGLAVVAIYNLGIKLYDRKTGIIAAVLAITSSNLWFHGEVALTYVIESFFSTVIALLIWEIFNGKENKVWLTACVLAIAGGVRQNTPVFLFPLCLFPVRTLPLKKIAGALCLFLTISLLWFVPMLVMSGGLDVYMSAFRELWTFTAGHSSVFERGWPLFKYFASALYNFIFYGIGGGTVVLAFSIYYILRNGRIKILANPKATFFSLWILPPFLFHLFIAVNANVPGHALIFLPPLILLVARVIVYLDNELCERLQKRLMIPAISILSVINLYIFFMLECPVSYLNLIRHDKELPAIVRYFRSLNPSTTVLFADYNNDMFFSFVHIMYYLPDYTIYEPNIMIARTGEIRKIFSRVHGETVLTHKIELPDTITDFATFFYYQDMKILNLLCKNNGVSIKQISPRYYVISGPISKVRYVFPEVRLVCDIKK